MSDSQHSSSPDNQFAERFGKLLRKMNLNQWEIADSIHSNQPTISKWKNGTATPHLDDIREMEKAWGRNTILWLLGLDNTIISRGIAWREQAFSREDFQYKDIQLGIELFRMIMQYGLSIEKIQQEHAQYSGMSVDSLRDLLKAVLFAGIVQVTDVERDKNREVELKAIFGLRDCIVANIDVAPSDHIITAIIRTEAVAFLAARDAIDTVAGVGSIGLTGGTTISRLVDLVPPCLPKLSKTKWISLMGSGEQVTSIGSTANTVVARMVYRQPGTTGYQLPFINSYRRNDEYYRKSKLSEHDELKYARFVQGLGRDLRAAFLSVGSPKANYREIDYHLHLPQLQEVLEQMSKAERERCAGDILLRLVDSSGERIGNAEDQEANNAFVYSVGLDDLTHIAETGVVWIVAASSSKADVIRGALVSKHANSLVIDSTTADVLLRP